MILADLAALRAGDHAHERRRGRYLVQLATSVGAIPSEVPNLSRDLVVVRRDDAGLAWARSFGARESGDVMHFDCRRDGVGALLYVP